jgi:hypothetical protein
VYPWLLSLFGCCSCSVTASKVTSDSKIRNFFTRIVLRSDHDVNPSSSLLEEMYIFEEWKKQKCTYWSRTVFIHSIMNVSIYSQNLSTISILHGKTWGQDGVWLTKSGNDFLNPLLP